MRKTLLGIGFIVAGLALAAFAFLADLIGVGVVVGIGYKQFLLGMAGIIIAVIGIILVPKRW